MSNTNIKAIILRLHGDHSIRCSAQAERKLLGELDGLWASSSLSKENVSAVVSKLPATFFSENSFDSTVQYRDLLWDALSDVQELQARGVTTITNFNAPVHTHILQTGSHSKAKISQKIQQNQLYTNAMNKALAGLSTIINEEITNDPDRAEALKVVSQAEIEVQKTNPNVNNINKYLLALGKWTGGRLTAAVDAAIAIGVKYSLTGSLQ